MARSKVPTYKYFNGKRYKLASQDIPKSQALRLARMLRKPVKGLAPMKARIVKEPNPKGIIWKQGRYRVYARRG